MFVMRQEQMAAFAEHMRQAFEDRIYAHVQKFFPQKCKALGEVRCREDIRYASDRAQHFKCETERQIVRWIDLAFMVCRDFDTARHTPWARRILADRTMPLEDKFSKLEFAAKRYGYPPPAKPAAA